ncbi:transglycosylase SLT domain-containing protein [Marinilabiliaceae bacterium ANBcel2]|nr:transglycosylase SLT domain-containing protein [Marinilabiliaceae bacterium ANBcel2]
MVRLQLLVLLVMFPLYAASQFDLEKEPFGGSVENRLEILDLQTPVELIHNNNVQAYIDVYTIHRKEHLANIIGRSKLYFPLFEEYLDKYGLPLELKYVAVIESALDPLAKSTSGAKGLWQFLYQASRLFDLEVSSYIDERSDPVKSTEAACRYLDYLYDNLHDWNLVLAAYNAGIASVYEAIEKADGESCYWKIRQHLSAEAQGYIPAFIAANYALNYYSDYDIEPGQPPFEYDDIGIINLDRSVSFQQISAITDVNIEKLRLLNPVYLRDYVPVNDSSVPFIIPGNKVFTFFRNRDQLVEERGPVKPEKREVGDTSGRKKITHTVEPGEFFHKIAINYRVRVEDIQRWNNIESRDLMAGQELIIWIEPEEPASFSVSREIKKELE